MKNLLFLCSGNTCRSPMAECLFNHLCEQRGLPFRALSAGVFATEGAPASDGANAAMKARGLSLRHHSAHPLSKALLDNTFMVVAMTPCHAELCKERFPATSTAIRSFSPSVSDPYGGSLAVYMQIASALETQVSALIDELAASE